MTIKEFANDAGAVVLCLIVVALLMAGVAAGLLLKGNGDGPGRAAAADALVQARKIGTIHNDPIYAFTTPDGIRCVETYHGLSCDWKGKE